MVDALAEARPVGRREGREGGRGPRPGRGRPGEGIRRVRQATEAALRDALGPVVHGLGLYAKAVDMHRKAMTVRETTLGPSHRDTLRSAYSTSPPLLGRRPASEAMPWTRRRWKLREAAGPRPPRHAREPWPPRQVPRARRPDRRGDRRLHEATLKLGPSRSSAPTIPTRSPAAATSPWPTADGRPASRGGRAARGGTLKACEAKLGPDHPDTLDEPQQPRHAYLAAGRIAEAAEVEEALHEAHARRLGPDHPDTLATVNSLAIAYRAAGRASPGGLAARGVAQAVAGEARARTTPRRSSAACPWRTPTSSAGRYAEAAAMLEATLKLNESEAGPGPSRHALQPRHSRHGLRVARPVARGRSPAGATNLAVRRETEKPEAPSWPSTSAPLGANLMKQAGPEAEPILRECLAPARSPRPDACRRYSAMSMLGGSARRSGQVRRGRAARAGGYEGMKAREAKITATGRFHLSEAAERVARLYRAWGKPEKERAWAEQLGLADLPADVFARP